MAFIIPTKQVIIMFILMTIGWLCYKVEFIHTQTAKDLTNLLLYIVSPCLIINSFKQKFTYARLVGFGVLFALVAFLFIFKILLKRLWQMSKKERFCVMQVPILTQVLWGFRLYRQF